MGLIMQERHAVTRELSSRFHRASKKERGSILTDFVQLTGYNRSYASFILRTCGIKQVRMVAGKRIVFIPAQARPAGSPRKRSGPYRTKAFLDALRQFWALSDGLCGKLLVAFIREIVPLLERQKRLLVPQPAIREQLMSVSAATIDRILAETKRESRLKGRSLTRPGTLLKHQIPVRTFADWDDVQPGFCEGDLVGHDGGSAYGDFCCTLTLTDVATTWTETEAAKNKARSNVFPAIETARARLPFDLLGLNTDNGGEFINAHLIQYCQDEHLTFTRGRPYRKNDNCYVEQKNNSVVRHLVGYYRYDTPEQLELLRKLYRVARLYTNFFVPVMKLKEKVRHGSKVTRRYDEPQTPYKRVLAHPQIPEQVKLKLTRQYESLNVVELKRVLNRLQQALFRSAIEAGPPPQLPPHVRILSPDHPWRKVGTLARKTQPQQPGDPSHAGGGTPS
jgi:hypothetical protein